LSVGGSFPDGFRRFHGNRVWRPRKLGIKGESLGHVHFAIEYLRNPEIYRLGRHVAIIGAGNVAMDVARTAFRHGCESVDILCNMDESCITARDVEVQYAKIDGAGFVMNKTAVEIVDEGVILADSKVCVNESGEKIAEAVPGTERLFPADSVIVAISQGPRSVIVSSTTGIEIKETGLVEVDAFGRTTREGIFASGDVVTALRRSSRR
jgi:glutamate synthase (NADPH/NADH) small chain